MLSHLKMNRMNINNSKGGMMNNSKGGMTLTSETLPAARPWEVSR